MKRHNVGFHFQGELRIIFLFCIIAQIYLFIILVFLRVPELVLNVIKRTAKKRGTKMQSESCMASVRLSNQKGNVGYNSHGEKSGIAKYSYICINNINLQNLIFLLNGLAFCF